MATEIKLPDMGEGIEDVTISRWRVPVGGTVKAGDIILEIATDKVDTRSLPPADGTVLAHDFTEGSLSPVSPCLASSVHQREADTGLPARPKWSPSPLRSRPVTRRMSATVGPPQAQFESAAAGNAARASRRRRQRRRTSRPPRSPARRRRQGVPFGSVSGTPGGQITQSDVLAYAGKGPGEAAEGVRGPA